MALMAFVFASLVSPSFDKPVWRVSKILSNTFLWASLILRVNADKASVTLSEEKYQVATLSNTTTIALPSVYEYAKITLYLNVLGNTTIIFPNIIWKEKPVLNKDSLMEIIFTYINDTWYAEVKIYTE